MTERFMVAVATIPPVPALVEMSTVNVLDSVPGVFLSMYQYRGVLNERNTPVGWLDPAGADVPLT